MQIGQFKSTGKGYAGKIETLTLNAEITLEPNHSSKPNTPDFRVFHGIIEIGCGYSKTAESGVEYISCKLDDPSFAYPIWASLFLNSKTDELALVWNRPKPKHS